ncbi:MAG: UDP-N-acetylmuramate dehydrogenase [Ignavibacteria bacterium]
MIKILENILLKDYTTIKLGGAARYFTECSTLGELREAVRFAKEKGLKIFVLGGGSNVVFDDEGFDGLIIKINLTGIKVVSKFEDRVFIKVNAGEVWDNFVDYAVRNSYGGVECMSFIPGLVGATPIQNVGAYGQEVKDVIIQVKAFSVDEENIQIFKKDECNFSYRSSIFKTDLEGKFIITSILLQLYRRKFSEVHHNELANYIRQNYGSSLSEEGEPPLVIIRDAVYRLREKKSMIVNPQDPDSFSCGSFFVNPIITDNEFIKLQEKCGTDLKFDVLAPDKIKISAAYLIEKAGFQKGFMMQGVGISSKHSLALVNKGGTFKQLIELINEIKASVFEKFDINLKEEPVIVKKRKDI